MFPADFLLIYLTIRDELDELVGCESFRDGFILGARLMTGAACGQGRFSDDI